MTLFEIFLPLCYSKEGNVADNAFECVEQADKYAIKFSEWLDSHPDYVFRYGKFKNKTLKELLLIFKTEKGL